MINKLDDFTDYSQLIKIDVEGYEEFVLNGASEILNHPKTKVYSTISCISRARRTAQRTAIKSSTHKTRNQTTLACWLAGLLALLA